MRFLLLGGILLLGVAFGFSTVTVSTASAACSNNATCRAQPGNKDYCKDADRSGTCVQCLINSHCGPSQVCKKDKCVKKTAESGNPNTPAETATAPVENTKAIDNQQCTTPRGLDGAETEIGCIPKDPAGFAAEYYSYGLGMIGGLSIIFIIIGGYIMLTSQGNPLRLRNGKTYIFYAVFGLLLAIFGYVFIEVIAVDILRIPGFAR